MFITCMVVDNLPGECQEKKSTYWGLEKMAAIFGDDIFKRIFYIVNGLL